MVVVVVVADLEGFQLLIWDVGESKKGPWAERHSHRTSVSHVWWPHSFAVVRWPFLMLYWSIKSRRAATNNLQSGVSDWTLYFLRMCGRKTTACTNIPLFAVMPKNTIFFPSCLRWLMKMNIPFHIPIYMRTHCTACWLANTASITHSWNNCLKNGRHFFRKPVDTRVWLSGGAQSRQ